MTKSRWSTLMTALLAAASTACSEGVARLSPVGPSLVAEAPASSSAATATAATWASSTGWSTFADGRVAVADGLLVEGVDVIGSVSGSCPSRSITVRGVSVALNAATTFGAPLTCATLTSGRAVRVRGMMTHLPGGFSVTATHLAPAGEEPAPAPATDGSGERMSGEGVVGAVSGSCPSLTMFILGHRVQTTTATSYRGGSCESVREGVMVRVDVEQQRDGTVVAETVAFSSESGHRQ